MSGVLVTVHGNSGLGASSGELRQNGVATRERRAHAGQVCGALGGGGTRRKGGVQAPELLLTVLKDPYERRTADERAQTPLARASCK